MISQRVESASELLLRWRSDTPDRARDEVDISLGRIEIRRSQGVSDAGRSYSD